MSKKRASIYIIEFENGFIMPVRQCAPTQGAMLPEEIARSFGKHKDKIKDHEVVVFKYKGTYPLEDYTRESGNEGEQNE